MLFQKKSHERGVALLVAVAALVAASTASVFALRAVQQTREVTEIQQNFKGTQKIRDAIAVWILQQGADDPVLPCPADPTDAGNFGDAGSMTGTQCDENRGIVPFATLTDISEEDVIDQYGRYYTYVVDQTDVSMCDGGDGRTGALSDNATGNTFAYALISHGENGAGGYVGANSQAGSNVSTAEDDNCPVDGSSCDVPVANEVRSRAPNADVEFDDIVRLVSGTSFDVECFDMFGDPLVAGDTSSNDRPAGAETSFEGDQATSNYNNASSGDRRNAIITDEDPDGTADSGDEFVQVYMRSGDSNPRSSCFWNEGAIDLTGRSVRAYVEASFDQDTTDSRRGALIMGFLRGDEPIANDLCGGEDTLLGWEDGPSNTLPVEKFGVELDTEGAVNSDALYEPSVNHIAMIATNIDHAGDDPDPANDADRDGPICDDSSDWDEAGTFSTEGDGNADPTESTLTNMEGCYPNADDWLESGTSTFHGFRVELHNHTGNDCPGPNPENWVRVSGWAFENASCNGDCVTLLEDYTEQNPNVSYCIPLEAVFSTLRFGFTSAGPAINTGQASEPRIRRFGINSDVIDTVTKDASDLTEETPQLSSLNWADEAGLTCASGQDADTSILTDDDITSDGSNARNPVFSSLRGVLACNNEGRMGVQGITDERRLDHVGVDTELWEDLFRREGIQVEFPETVTRYMVHLRDFEDDNDGTYSGPERAVVLAYNQDTFVGRKDAVSTCSGGDFAIIGDFDGDIFDRVVVIAEPADQTYTDSEGYSDIWVDGVKGCGAENACFPTDLDDTDVQGLITDCYDADFDTYAAPSSVQSGDETPQMNYTVVEGLYGSNSNNGGLMNLSDFDMKAFTDSGSGVYTHDDATRGFGVSSSVGNNHLESDANETLTFLFDRSFNALHLNVSRFTESATSQEQVDIEFRHGSDVIGTATVQSCPESGSGADGARLFSFDTLADVGEAFDRIVLIPDDTTTGGDTDVFIREVRACDASSGDCTLSSNASSNCAVDSNSIISVTVN